MAVIAISEQIGSRGTEMGRIAADLLNYKFITVEQVISEAAQCYRVTAEQLRVADDRQPHFWEWLRTDVERLYAYFRAIILHHLDSNNVVMAGRSISLVVPEGVGHAVRIRAVAPVEQRIAQIMKDEKLSRANAERRVTDADREQQARIQEIRAVDINDSALYDFVINTSQHPLPLLGELLAKFATEAEERADKGCCSRMRDACITAKARAALFAHPKIGHIPLDIQTENGVVRVSSEALTAPWDGLARDVIQKIDGVSGVQFEEFEMPMPTRLA